MRFQLRASVPILLSVIKNCTHWQAGCKFN